MNKTEILSQGGAGSPVPSPLCEAKAVCTEPGTPRILQVPFYPGFPTSNLCGSAERKNQIIQVLPETETCFTGRGLTSCSLDFRLWTTPRIQDRKLQESLRRR